MSLLSSDLLCPANTQAIVSLDWIRLLLIAPLLEECVFRLGVQHYLMHRLGSPSKRDAWLAACISTLLFSLMHFSSGWVAVFAVFFPGLALAVLYQIKKSYLLCVFTHSFFNGALLLACKW
jgi:membrane protease YdiL (CAAX protease family)